jgi:hypothetical protein
MARWRLMNPHYLNILDPDTNEPTKWEYSESDRTTGKARRKAFNVPQLLDPKDPSLCNRDGDLVVCQEGKGQLGDIVFFGSPTPDMEPMDEEAETISESLKAKWAHPIETLPANGGMNDAEATFMKNMMAAFAAQVGATPAVPNTSVSQEQYDSLKAQLDEMKSMMASMQPSSTLPAEPSTLRRA